MSPRKTVRPKFPRVDAMTPLAMVRQKGRHFEFLYRVSMELLADWRPQIERVLDGGAAYARLKVPGRHLKRLRPALKEAFRRLENGRFSGAASGSKKRRRPKG